MLLCKFQKGTGKINSETIGSIIDRLGILSIKKLHLTDARDERVKVIDQQIEVLSHCAKELMAEMISGERRCVLFSQFKIEYTGTV